MKAEPFRQLSAAAGRGMGQGRTWVWPAYHRGTETMAPPVMEGLTNFKMEV